MQNSPESESSADDFKPLTSPAQGRVLRAVNKKQQQLFDQWKAKREERVGSNMTRSSTETARAIGGIAALAALATGVIVFVAPKVSEAVSEIAKDAGNYQLDFEGSKGILGELKDTAELNNDIMRGSVDPADVTGLLPNDSTGWTESRNLNPGLSPTDLPESLPMPNTKQS